MVAYIREKKQFLEGLEKELEDFGHSASAYVTANVAHGPGHGQRSKRHSHTDAPAPPTYEKLQMAHARLSELLLQGLLRLDGIDIPNEYSEARKERKEAIRSVQCRLDEVDRVWSEVKRVHKKA